jgi:hypothetical protein
MASSRRYEPSESPVSLSCDRPAKTRVVCKLKKKAVTQLYDAGRSAIFRCGAGWTGLVLFCAESAAAGRVFELGPQATECRAYFLERLLRAVLAIWGTPRSCPG